MNNSHPRPRIMGILNVTPDSFSDGGEYIDARAAVEYGLSMVEQGADIIDIGGESTRPGAKRMPASVQIERVLPVIEGLKQVLPEEILISIDTSLAEVAGAAVRAGAGMINDISAGLHDPEMFPLAASTGLPLVLMHMQGTPETMQEDPVYTNVTRDILKFISARADQAITAGVEKRNIIIDPGLGFGKTFEHNVEIIRGLEQLVKSGYPVLLGASRKKFLRTICECDDFSTLSGATCAVTAMGVMAGVAIFRVHDVRENRQTVDVIHAIKNHSAAVAR